MDVKQAVAAAKAHLLDVFGAELMSAPRLEEVWFEDAQRVWCVTLGFFRKPDELMAKTGWYVLDLRLQGCSNRRFRWQVPLDKRPRTGRSVTHPRRALDSNLTLLLAVGRAERGLVATHERLRQYSEADYELLTGFLAVSDAVITTPNAMTEVSNIADFGIREPARSRVAASIRGLIGAFVEVYWQSSKLGDFVEFNRLGLADCSLLAVLDDRTRLLTVDSALYLAALGRGCHAVNFNHIRVARGLV